MDKGDRFVDKVGKYAGAFCTGYFAGKGVAYGFKAGMSQNNGPSSNNNKDYKSFIWHLVVL